MDACAYLRPRELIISSLCSAFIWGAFTLLWLLISVFSPRSSSLPMELFVAFIGIAKSAAGFIVAFVPINCVWQMHWGYIVLALVVSLATAMSTLLQLLISRGYGITRYTLTLAETVMFILFSLVLGVALLYPLLALLYLVIYVMFIIYACRTSSLLSLQNPAFSHEQNKAIRLKKQVFQSMMLIIVAAVALSIAVGVTQAALQDEDFYRFLYVCGVCIVEVLFTTELLLLHYKRSDPIYSNPLVAADEVYLIRQSLVERGTVPAPPVGSQPPFQYQPYPPIDAPPTYVAPQSGNPYPQLPGPYVDRRY